MKNKFVTGAVSAMMMTILLGTSFNANAQSGQTKKHPRDTSTKVTNAKPVKEPQKESSYYTSKPKSTDKQKKPAKQY